MNALRQWYRDHLQKTLASLLGMLAVFDLTPYGDAITTVVGTKGYAVIRLVVAGAIFWRALQVRQQRPLPAPDPSANR